MALTGAAGEGEADEGEDEGEGEGEDEGDLDESSLCEEAAAEDAGLE